MKNFLKVLLVSLGMSMLVMSSTIAQPLVKSSVAAVEHVSCSTVHGEMIPFVKKEEKPTIKLEEGVAIDKEQFRALIKDVLEELDLYSKSAVEQLMLTSATESHLGTYIQQIRGVAQGAFQMEPATEKDIWNNYLRYKPELAERVKDVCGTDKPFALKADLVYQIAMARVHYLRVPTPLPPHDDVIALATYWKDHYNTRLGKGTVEKAVESYEVYVA